MASSNNKDNEPEIAEGLSNPCLCSFAVTGQTKAYQAIFVCRTCCSDGKELLCVCEACANRCHEIHDELDYLGMGQAYCDCARLSNCKILDDSIRLVKDSNYPVGGIKFSPMLSPLNSSKEDGPAKYIMDVYSITELHSSVQACKNLVDQASELVTHSKETFWLDHQQDQQSWCDLEKMAWQIYDKNRSKYGLELHENGGAEWWVQVKNTTSTADDLAIDLHYDKDEALAEKFGLGSFPILSTVMYLTDNSIPTVIFGRTYEDDDDEVIADMLISHPVVGKHLVFDGRLLHCVSSHPELRRKTFCPGSNPNNSNGSKIQDLQAKRVTLLVNIWNRKPLSIEELSHPVRNRIKEKFKTKGKHKIDYSDISNFQAQFPEEAVLEDESMSQEETRIELPFVCKGITWESEDDESSGLVLITFPPPGHQSDTIYVRFGPGLQAYLDQAFQDDGFEGPNMPMNHGGEPGYEEAYV